MASYNWSGEIAAYLKLGADATSERGALLAAIGDSVQAAVERYIGRTLERTTYTEVYDGHDRATLFLRNAPVASVTSLSVNGATVTVGSLSAPAYPPATVVIKGGNSLMYTDGNVFTAGTANVIVTYVAGFDVMPPDIRQAVVTWSALIFKDRDRAGLGAEGVGGQSTSFVREMPPFVRDVLTKWQRWGKPC